MPILMIIEFFKHFQTFRTLLYGVCRTIAPVGPMEGALGGRFFIVFITTLASIIIKGLSMCVVIHFVEEDHWPSYLKVFLLIALFLPQLMMSLFSTTEFFQCEFLESLKLMCHHPDLILLPLGNLFVRPLFAPIGAQGM